MKKNIDAKEIQYLLAQHNTWTVLHAEEGKGRLVLKNALLSNVDVPNEYLGNSMLTNVTFSKVNFENSVFEFAAIKNCHFIDCNLADADFKSTKLKGTTFNNCDLKDTDFRNAKMNGTNFDSNILNCFSLYHTVWALTDIPWYIQHPRYHIEQDTIKFV